MQRGGQDREKERAWRRLIRGQPRSGLSIREWCRRHRVREASYYWWRRRLAQRDASAPTFVPVRVTTEPATSVCPTSHIEIVWPDQRCVRVVGPVDRLALRNVLAVLRDEGVDEATANVEQVRCVASRKARSC